MRMKRIRLRNPQLLAAASSGKPPLATGKVSQWPLVFSCEMSGIAVGIVDELVMGQVLQAIVVRGAEEREHGEQIGGEIVQRRLRKRM